VNAWSIALDSIWHHKLRSALTALGIVIGVFAVVTLTSLGASVKAYIAQQFNTFGANIITVAPAAPAGQRGSHVGFGFTVSTLTLADAQAIGQLSGVQAAAPVVSAEGELTAGSHQDLGATVVGTTAPYFAVEHLAFASGKPMEADQQVVLGHAAATTLFGNAGQALGQSVRIGSSSYTVVGVLAPSGNTFGGDPDNTVYISADQGLALAGTQHLSEIVVAATTDQKVPAVAAAIVHRMDQLHPLRDFQVVTAAQILATINRTLSVITSVLAGIAAISLLVGGIGIMNIMLVTVTERTREIGTRKALGARDADILGQFLVEAVLLSVLGGAVGTGLSALASHIVGRAVNFPIHPTVTAVAAALAFSVGVGAVFGVLPAWRAARLMPAEALRSE